MRVLATGFEPFGGDQNATGAGPHELIDAAQQRGLGQWNCHTARSPRSFSYTRLAKSLSTDT